MDCVSQKVRCIGKVVDEKSDETSQVLCYSTKKFLCQFFLYHVFTLSVSHATNNKNPFKNLYACARKIYESDSNIVSFPNVLAPSMSCLKTEIS